MGTNLAAHDTWSSGDAYERYVGRWSRLVAKEFIRWLAIPQDSQWLDVGCGTGALSQTIIELQNPKRLTGIDRSEDYINRTRSRVKYRNAEFKTGDAQALPVDSESYDVAVSGLVLNFVPQHYQMISEMRRAVKTNGMVAIYVWDYANKMQFMRHFWNAVIALDPSMSDHDEGKRFPICNPERLHDLFQNAGLHGIDTRPIDIFTDFKDFDDFWLPFLGGQGPAAGYAMSLTEERRAQLRERVYNSLPFAMDGSISLIARAWAIKAFK